MNKKRNTTSIFIPILFIISAIFLSSCSNNNPLPKPKTYFRIDLPEKEYTEYNCDCPFKFEYPKYSKIETKNSYEPCWLDITFPQNNAVIYFTYKKVDNNLDSLTNDSYEFAYKHTIKADAIDEYPFINFPNKVFGILYDLKGNTATAVQFFLTDSTHHFVRASLYFNTVPNKDSLKPVIEFIREDIVHLIETFEWKN